MRRHPHRLIRVCVPNGPMSKRGTGPRRRETLIPGVSTHPDRKDFVKDSMDFCGEGG